METAPWEPRLHLLVCTNRREGSDLPSCAPLGAEQVLAQLRKEARKRGLPLTVQMTATGCLGWCNQGGTTVAAWPAGTFYRAVQPDDCPRLLDLILAGNPDGT